VVSKLTNGFLFGCGEDGKDESRPDSQCDAALELNGGSSSSSLPYDERSGSALLDIELEGSGFREIDGLHTATSSVQLSLNVVLP
jgi:hypothetical protein